MIFKRRKIKKKKAPVTIFFKLLLVFTLCTVIPTIVSGTLIALTYQEAAGKGFSISLEQIRTQIGLSIITIIALVLFGVIIVSRSLTRPLKKLLKATEEVAKGNLDIEVKVESGDELGKLTNHFNKMTSQLKETNKEIDKKTKQLKERIQELENFYKTTIDRELRIIDLKKKIKQLERKNIHKNTYKKSYDRKNKNNR